MPATPTAPSTVPGRHTLTVADPGRLVAQFSVSIPPQQVLRELLHNGFHAIGAHDPDRGSSLREVLITATERDGHRKLSVVDTGCGMSPTELVTLIGQLTSSSTNVGGSRFGLGAKIAGLATSPHGIEYLSWDGTSHPVRAVLANRDAGPPGFLPLDGDGNITQGVPVQSLEAALEEVSSHRGEWAGDGVVLRWYYNDGTRPQRRFNHGDNSKLHTLCALTLRDPEVPGLVEVYHLDDGAAGVNRLGQFGLAAVASKVALVIEVTDPARLDVHANQERTSLTFGGQPPPWATAFRDDMPEELDRLVHDSIDARSVAYDEVLTEFFAENRDLFDPAALEEFAAAYSTGGVGGRNPSGARGGTGEGNGSAGTSRGGPGTGPGGRANRVVAGDSGGQLPVVPKVSEWEDPPDQYRHCFGYWDHANQVLLVNEQLPDIEAELARHLKGRRLSARDRAAARKELVDTMTLAALEGVVRILIKRQMARNESEAMEWDFALEPTAITNLVRACGQLLGVNPPP